MPSRASNNLQWHSQVHSRGLITFWVSSGLPFSEVEHSHRKALGENASLSTTRHSHWKPHESNLPGVLSQHRHLAMPQKPCGSRRWYRQAWHPPFERFKVERFRSRLSSGGLDDSGCNSVRGDFCGNGGLECLGCIRVHGDYLWVDAVSEEKKVSRVREARIRAGVDEAAAPPAYARLRPRDISAQSMFEGQVPILPIFTTQKDCLRGWRAHATHRVLDDRKRDLV